MGSADVGMFATTAIDRRRVVRTDDIHLEPPLHLYVIL